MTTRRDFLKGLAVVGAALTPGVKAVQLQELKCVNCQAPLVITGEYSCECEYCGAEYVVSNLEEAIDPEPEDRSSDPSDYFWDGNGSWDETA